MKSKIKLILVLLAATLAGNAQNRLSDVTISILTCAPGNDIYTIYGHNAIRIADKLNQTDIVYNYGTFDFETPGFVVKFMRGKLPYLLTAVDFDMFLREYQYFERGVSEQILNLDDMQKRKIIEALAINMLPENIAYKYDFFMDNCATRLRDMVVNNASNVSLAQNKSSGKTFRQIIKEYQQKMPWINFGIDLIIGAKADKITTYAEETFIPDYLANALDKMFLNNKVESKLVNRKGNIISFEVKPPSNPWLNFFLSPLFFFIILLLLEINLLFRCLRGHNNVWIKRYDIAWCFLLGFASLLMIFMWFGTDHIPTKDNWNLLWANPLIPLWWIIKDKQYKIVKVLSYLILVFLIISIVNAIPGLRFLPQYFHPIVGIIAIIILIKGWRKSQIQMA
ncbi:MAG: DUF4105 domain-containing protein [Saprospiraceae bacterium]|nr:DUF4105 domain-containing protein [Saprospiraceae bacterium]